MLNLGSDSLCLAFVHFCDFQFNEALKKRPEMNINELKDQDW